MRKKSLGNFTSDNKLNKQKKRIRVVATALLLCIVTKHTPVYATVNDNLNTGLRLAVEAITDMLSKDHKDINKSGDIKEQTNYLVQESDAARQDIQSARASVENKLDTGITNLANAITSTEDRLKSKINTSESSINTAITNARTAINNNTDTRKNELSDSLTSHNNTVVQKLDSVFQSVNDGKKQLANTIIDRGGIVGNKDTIYSWSTLNNGVDRIYTDRYATGKADGITEADNRVNPASAVT